MNRTLGRVGGGLDEREIRIALLMRCRIRQGDFDFGKLGFIGCLGLLERFVNGVLASGFGRLEQNCLIKAVLCLRVNCGINKDLEKRLQ